MHTTTQAVFPRFSRPDSNPTRTDDSTKTKGTIIIRSIQTQQAAGFGATSSSFFRNKICRPSAVAWAAEFMIVSRPSIRIRCVASCFRWVYRTPYLLLKCVRVYSPRLSFFSGVFLLMLWMLFQRDVSTGTHRREETLIGAAVEHLFFLIFFSAPPSSYGACMPRIFIA